MSALLGAGFGTVTSIIGGFVGGDSSEDGITELQIHHVKRTAIHVDLTYVD